MEREHWKGLLDRARAREWMMFTGWVEQGVAGAATCSEYPN